jgi:hypothetical protein
MKVQVTLSNYLTKENEKFELLVPNESTYEDISKMHNDMSKQNPNCNINFSWNNGESFIYGMIYNQSKDEQRLDRCEISWDEYENKWCNCNSFSLN